MTNHTGGLGRPSPNAARPATPAGERSQARRCRAGERDIMTIKEFVNEALSRLKDDPEFLPYRSDPEFRLRILGPGDITYCPLTAVVAQRDPDNLLALDQYRSAGEVLGFDDEAIDQIVWAADNNTDNMDRDLYREMAATLGVEVPA